MLRQALSFALLAGLLAAPAEARPAPRPPVTILISIDGFRPDYLSRGATPNLNALAARGISASMRPSFPSKTFPNHTTLVTGLVPDHNGIIANSMVDAKRPGEKFTMATEDPYWWQDAEPVWIAAEKAGIRTATLFWPGSNVPHDGLRPQDWQQFNIAVSNTQRVNGIVDWLRRPSKIRPRFLTLYFDAVDTAGHEYGPDSPEVTKAAGEVDSAIGQLTRDLRRLHQRANLVIVADHGMAAIDETRKIRFDSVANPADYTLIEDGPFVMANAVPGHEEALAAALANAPRHMQCWRKGQLPERLHYGTHRRMTDWFCLADTGWMLTRGPQKKPVHGGTHGYDNAAPEMRALFIASGPAIRAQGRLPDFDNTDIEPLLRDLIGLPQGAHRDGDDAPFRKALGR